jgi:hypothetical protein
MTFSPRSITIALKDKLLAYGYTAAIADPASPPPAGLSVYIAYAGLEDPENSLNSISLAVVYDVLFYMNVTSGPTEEAELAMGDAPFRFWEQVMGDFDLGVSGVRSVQPSIIPTTWGYADIGGQSYRTLTMRLGVMVNDVVMLVA